MWFGDVLILGIICVGEKDDCLILVKWLVGFLLSFNFFILCSG